MNEQGRGGEGDGGLSVTTTTAATTWNGGVCGICTARFLGSHTCSVEDLLNRSDELRAMAMRRFEALGPEPTIGPPTDTRNADGAGS